MMLLASGELRKMSATLDHQVQYDLTFSDSKWHLNPLIGKVLRLRYLGAIHCVQCGRKTSKSFQQGHCFPCMQRINECGNCIIHPERCLVEQGGCPQDDWAHAHCHADQMVYLSNTSGLKVGVTRASQVPTRWIDQGAMQAIAIFSAQNRLQAGLLEVALKAFVNDKTNWRTMLKQDSTVLDMQAERDRLLIDAESVIAPILSRYDGEIVALKSQPVHIRFPIDHYLSKIVSHSFDKQDEIEGRLQGIKGQYLVFDTGVLNLRKFAGYSISVNVEEM